MKISNGTIFEMVLAIFFLLVGFNIKDSFTSFIVILISIIVIIHTLYIFFSKDKNNFANCNDNNLEKKSSSNGFIKIFLIIVLILIILLVGVSSFQGNTNNKKKSEKEDDTEKLTTQTQEPCSYYPIDGNYNIIISAESSSGVGDVFSKMDSNLEYRIHDNNYGDTYISERKYQGDQTRYECDEIWYEVYLQNGKHGFIWAGRDGMYAKEQ